MKNQIISVRISNLLIWSENPRLPQKLEKTDEESIMNSLISVVGKDKMYNLAKDIAANGLDEADLMVIVQENGSSFVFDGNRRTTMIKALRNPSSIQDPVLKNQLERLASKYTDSDILDDRKTISVCLAVDKNEAYRIMDLRHSGEQNGKGLMGWESFSIDRSRVARNVAPIEPVAYKVATLLNFTEVSFKKISYTDIQRLFSAAALKTLFGILTYDDVSPENKTKVQAAYDAILAFRTEKKISSLSRYFNYTDIENAPEGEDSPMARFCDWYNTSGKYDASISFVDDISLFTCDRFSISDLRIKIIDKHGTVMEHLTLPVGVSFVTPSGQRVSTLDTSVIGAWKSEVVYGEQKKIGKITINPFKTPAISFKMENLAIGKNTPVNLMDNIASATGRRGQTLSSISFSIDDSTLSSTAPIEGNLLPSQNSCGVVRIKAKAEDQNIECSGIFNVLIKENSHPMMASVPESKLLNTDFAPHERIITFDPLVAELINEINSVPANTYKALIACSLRVIVEMCLDRLSIGHAPISLEQRINLFASKVSGGGAKSINTQKPNAFLNVDDIKDTWKDSQIGEALSGLLNGGSHRASWLIPWNDLVDRCHGCISQMIYITDLVVVDHLTF